MSDPSRRDWIRLVGAGTAALAVGCGDNAPTREVAVAILDPSSDALTVAIWARSGREAIVEVRAGDRVARTAATIGESRSAAVDIDGLAAATAHEVTIDCGGVRLGPYRARTAPADDDPRPIRIAIAADADPDPEFDTDLVDHLVAADPELLVSLGDFPYTDNGPPAMTVDAYRDRHAELRTLPKFRALHEAMAIRAIYDDHEFRNNWDARFAMVEADRFAAAMTVWDEFFPVRGATTEVRYRRWRWGAHAECFLLDCRRFRSANAAPDDAHKTMLGDTQRAWFLDAIARSTATFKLVFTSVPLDFGIGLDHWAGFQRERAVIFDALLGIPGVVFLSADQHWLAAHRHDHGIRELQIGPLARGIGTPGPAAPGVLFRAAQYNVGLVDIDGDQLVLSAIGAGGVRLYEEALTADQLTPRQLSR